jgi:hypothetical protein
MVTVVPVPPYTHKLRRLFQCIVGKQVGIASVIR